MANLVLKKEIGEDGDFNLSANRYLASIDYSNISWPIVELRELITYVRGVTYSKSDEVEEGGLIVLRANNIDLDSNQLDLNDLRRVSKSLKFKEEQELIKNDILICSASGSKKHIGKVAFIEKDIPYYIGGFMGAIRTQKELLPRFLFELMKGSRFRNHIEASTVGANIRNLKSSIIETFKIPLPPLAVQEEIVAEIEEYQKIIDGARQVVENYRPRIKVDPEWPLVELGDECDKITKGTTPTTNGFKFVDGGINFIKIESITDSGIFLKDKFAFINEECDESLKRSRLKNNDILFSIAGALGRVAIVTPNILPANTNQALAIIRLRNNSKISNRYLFYLLKSDFIQKTLSGLKVGVAQYNLSLKQIKEFKIPIPSLKTQDEIVFRIEEEQSFIEGNFKLIKTFEKKIEERIGEVWGEGKE